MSSAVKRPTRTEKNPKEEELFDKLVHISVTYSKSQYEEALKEIADLRAASNEAKKEGHDVAEFERELKR